MLSTRLYCVCRVHYAVSDTPHPTVRACTRCRPHQPNTQHDCCDHDCGGWVNWICVVASPHQTGAHRPARPVCARVCVWVGTPHWVCRWLMAAGKRPVPFRTRKLSPPAPMVLPPGGGGRVGYRRPNNFTPTPATHQPNWCAAGVLYTQPPAHTTHAHRGHCIADTAGTPPIPQRGLLGRQGGSAPLRTTPVTHCGHRDSALQTMQVPTDSAMQTSRREGWFSLIADSASLHCGHGRYQHTPQCRLVSR